MRDLVAALRTDLTTAGYTVDAVREVLGLLAASALLRERRLPASMALAGRGDSVSVLARTFLLPA